MFENPLNLRRHIRAYNRLVGFEIMGVNSPANPPASPPPAGHLRCALCDHVFRAEAPAPAQAVECPGCGAMGWGMDNSGHLILWRVDEDDQQDVSDEHDHEVAGHDERLGEDDELDEEDDEDDWEQDD